VPAGQKTKAGVEKYMAINCIGPLLLTQLLLPQLQVARESSASPRVVWTSSHLGERFADKGGMDFDALAKGGKGDPMLDYGVSKAGNWLLAHELAVRYPDIISVVQNPGNLDTAMYDDLPWMLHALLRRLVLHEIKLGAYTLLFAGLSPAISTKQNGAYLFPFGRIIDEKSNSRPDVLKGLKKESEGGTDVGRRFWVWCEQHFAK
jgi:NAD(P)-dependent dehydrogenase (short-subunit alcohol dehydrogenase family)